ncbi:MAG: ShlB/FhaC/HecB family hemolysin secretion/activation protein [Candidatus Omnitrophica bacterium]|nr:ShlB/FhaC/HecB family hemolysin secretion/activation protein [Candidatus Omnitrophota bacterium]
MPRHGFLQGALIVFLISLLGFLEVAAAAGVELAPSEQPESIKERIRKEMEERAEPEKKPEPAVELPPELERPPVAEGPRFPVRQITLKGNTVIPTAELELPIASLHRGPQMSLKELQELADVIQQQYRSRGYLTTIALVPPQRIEEGKAVIEIVEGRLGQVIIEGNRYFSTAQIRRVWPIVSGEVLRYQKIRRALRRLNANPSRRVQALLRPGNSPGTTDVVLKVVDRFPLRPTLFSDRRGTKVIGEYRFGWSLRHSNLLGRDDSLIIGMVAGRAFGAGFGQYAWPLGSYGTRLILAATHAQVSARRQFKPFGVNGISETYSVALDQPLISEELTNLDLKVGLDFSESRTKVLSAVSRRDRLRAIRLETNLRHRDKSGSWTMGPEVALGLKGLGSSSENNPLAGRAGAAPDFKKFQLNLTRTQQMPWATQLNFGVTGQMVSSKLTPQEELYLGGASTVRGYPEGDYLADQGIFTRLDYLIPAFWIPGSWRLPGFDLPLKDALQTDLFLDRGYGRLRAVTGEEHRSRNLMGTGFGFVLQGREGLSGRIEWGRNIGDRPLTDDSRYRVHFQLQQEF